MQEPLQRASIVEEHHTQMGVVMEKVRSAKIAELNRKLRLSDEELDRINKRFNETQGM